MKKLLILILGAMVAFAQANETIHLNLLESSKGLLEPKESAISLEQAKELAAGDNIDARLAYEKLYQAQQKIYQARAEFFPYGVGDIAVLYLTNFWNPLILAELVTSLPSKWYNVKANKHLRNAEAFGLKALRENVKNQMAHLYYSVLKEQTALELTGYEVRLYEEMIRALKIQEEAGLASRQEVHNAEMSALSVRDEYLKLSSYLAEAKAAVKMVMDLPYSQEDYEFQPVKDFLSDKEMNIRPESLALTSLNRSPEIKAAWELINATADSAVSAKWSIISFQGLGFNYMSRVRFAYGKHQQAIYQKEALERNIENEVYSREEALDSSISMLRHELTIANQSKHFMASQLAAYKAGDISSPDLIEADIFFVRDYRNAINSHYNSLIKLDDLERISLGNVESDFLEEDFDVAVEEREEGVSISISGTVAPSEITSVTYSFSDKSRNDIKAFNAQNDFSVIVPRPDAASIGHATIIFANGEALKKQFTIDSI